MSDNIKISIDIPLDENGMIGRECLECEKYFKLKPGTGLPTSHCHCPYCEYEGEADTFWTPAQLEYAKSIALNEAFNQIIKPSFDKLNRSFKELERRTRNNSFFKITVKTSGQSFSIPIKYYSEEELETSLTCDNCGLEFSIFGVFAQCPDCNELNAFLIFEKSIDATNKQLDILTKPDMPKEIKENSLMFILSSCVSAFDGLGKELRKRKPDLYPDKPNNLFQNLYSLNLKLNNFIETKHPDFDFLIKLFQVRHLYEHNMGVIDDDFIKKLPIFSKDLGKKYILTEKEMEKFISSIRTLGEIMKDHFLTSEKK
ncbi:MAG: hypothetical protein K0M40_07415 [Prolixibacteraceae bacterium]|nr:hypothetical protein [Prolixibacteraceae bacterium]